LCINSPNSVSTSRFPFSSTASLSRSRIELDVPRIPSGPDDPVILDPAFDPVNLQVDPVIDVLVENRLRGGHGRVPFRRVVADEIVDLMGGLVDGDDLRMFGGVQENEPGDIPLIFAALALFQPERRLFIDGGSLGVFGLEAVEDEARPRSARAYSGRLWHKRAPGRRPDPGWP